MLKRRLKDYCSIFPSLALHGVSFYHLTLNEGWWWSRKECRQFGRIPRPPAHKCFEPDLSWMARQPLLMYTLTPSFTEKIPEFRNVSHRVEFEKTHSWVWHQGPSQSCVVVLPSFFLLNNIFNLCSKQGIVLAWPLFNSGQFNCVELNGLLFIELAQQQSG